MPPVSPPAYISAPRSCPFRGAGDGPEPQFGHQSEMSATVNGSGYQSHFRVSPIVSRVLGWRPWLLERSVTVRGAGDTGARSEALSNPLSFTPLPCTAGPHSQTCPPWLLFPRRNHTVLGLAGVYSILRYFNNFKGTTARVLVDEGGVIKTKNQKTT